MTVQLFCGDCLDILPTLETGSVDAVITDPPYGVQLRKKRTKMRSRETIERPGRYSHEDTPEYIKSVCVPAIELCRTLAKSVALTPGTRNMWLYPAPDDVGCFYSAANPGMGRWGFKCMQPILYYGKDPYQAAGKGCYPNSCGQTYPNDANKIQHPCAKPLRMMLWFVQRASLEGMTVLDPFMGSGTTGVACIQTGRNFIGIEIDPNYFEIAKTRIEQAQAEMVQARMNI